MSSWPTPRMIEVRRQKGLTALPAIEAFVRSHKGYSIDEDQDGSHGNTNYVVFGHLDSEAVVFKLNRTEFSDANRTAFGYTWEHPRP